jgi:YEATS domain-containing protein 1/3
VKEYGYAGFELPIEIHFRNKEDPKKITYDYDLFLNNEEVVQNTRREKLTFQNPSPDFKKKLLRAGGVSILIMSFALCPHFGSLFVSDAIQMGSKNLIHRL